MLNFLNRLITIIVLLVLIVALIAVAVTPEGVASFLATQLGLVRIDTFSLTHLIVAVVCIVLALLFLWILGMEFRRQRVQAVPVNSASGGATTIAPESVVQRLRNDVEQVPGVRQVAPLIRGGSRGVDIVLDVRTDPDVDVPAKLSEIDQVARQSVESMGVRLKSLRTHLQVARGASSNSVS